MPLSAASWTAQLSRLSAGIGQPVAGDRRQQVEHVEELDGGGALEQARQQRPEADRVAVITAARAGQSGASRSFGGGPGAAPAQGLSR